MDHNPEHLRARLVRLYALALQVRDTDPEFADMVIAEAIALQDRAAAEEAFEGPPTARSRSPQLP
jgi:hypothetical protein